MKFILSFVNNKIELFNKLSKSSQPEVNAELKRNLYRIYLEQPSSAE